MDESRLTLTASDFQGPSRWYWRLTKGDVFLADHSVDLDTSAWQYEAYLDLNAYLRLHANPDRRREHERELIAAVGEWMGREVLGEAIGRSIVEATTTAPLTVHVTIQGDDGATALAEGVGDGALDHHVFFRPLELAHVDGVPLASRDVSLVFDTRPAHAAADAAPAAAPLRMLAVFSLPQGVSALNLRHERQQLRQIVRALAADRGLDVVLRVLQYGVTRDSLKKTLEDGWDVLHFSGHGLASRLILEKDDGSSDEVSTDELLELVRTTRGRLKWVTLSACLSAASTAAETLRWLGIEPSRRRDVAETPSLGDAQEGQKASEVPDAEDDVEAEDASARRMPVLARELAEKLDCAVLAMRFPVGDEFAIELGKSVYERVLDGKPLPRALQLAISDLCAGSTARLHPTLSIGTPALFGRGALDLVLRPAQSDADPFEVSDTGLGFFPPPSEQLVGRVQALTEASRALASRSGFTGVLFHGMAGAGKTSCATELAWQHEDVGRFQGFVWYKAPDEGHDITKALLDFALAMEQQLPGLTMATAVDRAEDLAAFLPRLANALGKRSVLIVLDNLESLLRKTSSQPAWRDERWGEVIDALLSHGGESRAILTSRRPLPIGASAFAKSHPAAQAKPPAERLRTLPIHALSLDEAALLARQLPNLRRIIEGGHAANDLEADTHRELVARTLKLVQGHPKLMDLAEGQAVDPATLAGHLKRAESAAASGKRPLEAFFKTGESELAQDDFLATLSEWTRSIVASLSKPARELLGFLACLEEPDRTESVVAANWQDYLDRRARGGGDAPEEAEGSDGSDEGAGEGSTSVVAPPDPEAAGAALQELAASTGVDSLPELLDALVEGRIETPPELAGTIQALREEQARAERLRDRLRKAIESIEPALGELRVVGLVEELRSGDGDGAANGWRIHPGVAEAVRALAGGETQRAVDAELGDYWIQSARHGLLTESAGGGSLVATAGLRAAPYLIRTERWDAAANVLEKALGRDKSPESVAAILPFLRRCAEATDDPTDASVLAKALLAAGRRDEAERILLGRVDEIEQQGRFASASAILGQVINIMLDTGRAQAALALVERKRQLTRKAGLSRWSELIDEGQRLQLLARLGRSREVLQEVERLRGEIAALDDNETDGTTSPWNVRELILDVGRGAAHDLRRFEKSLSLNAEIQASEEARGASELDRAMTRYNDYAPLIGLNRLLETRGMLLEIRGVLERHRNVGDLGKVLTALADVEDELGHIDRALDSEMSALRYSYIAGDPDDCAVSHFNLAIYLERSQRPAFLEQAIAHRVCCATIQLLTKSGWLARTLQSLSSELDSLDPASPAAALVAEDGSGFDRIVEIVESIEGVRFRELFERLPKAENETGPDVLRRVLALARETESVQEAPLPPEVAALLERIQAGVSAGEDVEPLLAELRGMLVSGGMPEEAADHAIESLRRPSPAPQVAPDVDELFERIDAAASAGDDVEPLLAELRERMRADGMPDEVVEAFVEGIREQLDD